jgi:hypothetical protein
MPRKNPLERTEYNKAYYQKNRKKRCWQEKIRYVNGGKEHQEAYRIARLARYAEYQRNQRQRRPKDNMVISMRARAKKFGLPCDVTVADLDWPTHCPVLGVELDYNATTPGNRKIRTNYPTLDRWTNALGYVKGNVFVISHRANRIKSDATVEELRAVLAYMERQA